MVAIAAARGRRLARVAPKRERRDGKIRLNTIPHERQFEGIMPRFPCVVVGYTEHGKLSFFECVVECTDEEAEDGGVESLAREQAIAWGLTDDLDMLVVDHGQVPGWFAEQFFQSQPLRRNLERWRESGQAHRWVWQRGGRWDRFDWTDLLATVRKGEYWPMAESDVGRLLEELKRDYAILHREKLVEGKVASFATEKLTSEIGRLGNQVKELEADLADSRIESDAQKMDYEELLDYYEDIMKSLAREKEDLERQLAVAHCETALAEIRNPPIPSKPGLYELMASHHFGPYSEAQFQQMVRSKRIKQVTVIGHVDAGGTFSGWMTVSDIPKLSELVHQAHNPPSQTWNVIKSGAKIFGFATLFALDQVLPRVCRKCSYQIPKHASRCPHCTSWQ